MNKSQLIEAMAKKADLSRKDAGATLDAFIDAVTETLEKGDGVQLIGFGSFGVRERAAREGRNPQTGETVKIAASKVPYFKPGQGLKDRVK